MGSANKPDISIRMEKPGKDYRLVFHFLAASTEIESKPLTVDDLIKIQENHGLLLKDLYSINQRRIIRHQNEIFWESYRKIRKFGSSLLMKIFSSSQLADFQSLFLRLLVVGMERNITMESPVGTIEYVGNLDFFFPIDYLFIRIRECHDPPENKHFANLCLSQILGFSFVVKRWFPNNLGKILKLHKRLLLDLYVGKSTHTADEADFFKKDNRNIFSIETEITDWTATIPGTLMDRFISILNQNPSDVCHLACNCTNSDDDPYMEFDNTHYIYLSELKQYYVPPPQNPENKNRPLTFLNMCYGSEINLFSEDSFIHMFLEHFSKGVIGPGYKIPGNFACEFAKVFYSYLLLNGQLGEAFFKARWFFAKKYNNILGLFYTLYADPEISLSQTVDSINI